MIKVVDLVEKVHGSSYTSEKGFDHILNVISDCIMTRAVLFHYLYKVNDWFSSSDKDYLSRFKNLKLEIEALHIYSMLKIIVEK